MPPRSSASSYPGLHCLENSSCLRHAQDVRASSSGYKSRAPAAACGIWKSFDCGRIQMQAERYRAASAQLFCERRMAGSAKPQPPGWQRGNRFAFRGTRDPFFHHLPHNVQAQKIKKRNNRRGPQETQFIFLSPSSPFSFLLSTLQKKS